MLGGLHDRGGRSPAQSRRAVRPPLFYDHFHTVPVPTEEVTHEAWSLMAALGAATQRVRLGQMCTCMGYRNPAFATQRGSMLEACTLTS